VPVPGQSVWWIWFIRSEAGVVIDRSKVQFRSVATAEAEGHMRLVVRREDSPNGSIVQ